MTWNSFLWDLFAIVIHCGDTIKAGHYWCYLYEHNKWLICNDKRVISTTFQHIIGETKKHQNTKEGGKQSASMLFYRRQHEDIDMKTQQTNIEEQKDDVGNHIQQMHAIRNKQIGILNGKYRRLLKYEIEIYDNMVRDTSIGAETIIIQNDEYELEVKRKDLDRILPGEWLNDEIVNGYCRMIHNKVINNKKSVPSNSKVLILGSFFYTKLTSMDRKKQISILKTALVTTGGMDQGDVEAFIISVVGEQIVHDFEEVERDDFVWVTNDKTLTIETIAAEILRNDYLKDKKDRIIGHIVSGWEALKHEINYGAVKRWTKTSKLRKRGFDDCEHIFDFDKILMPIHENGNHWTNICIDINEKSILYRNSINNNGSGWTALVNIGKYLNLEFQDKVKDKFDYEFDLTGWGMEIDSDYPQQEGTIDCAVFALKCIEWEAEGIPIDYNQEKVEYFRKRMMVEFIHGYLLK
eukprot:544744_1